MKNICRRALFPLLALGFAPFAIASEDWMVKDLVDAWAQPLGKPVAWEAGAGYETLRVQLEATPHPTTWQGFGRAMDGLREVLASSREVEPLRACVFANAVVVRTLAQPACSSPVSD